MLAEDRPGKRSSHRATETIQPNPAVRHNRCQSPPVATKVAIPLKPRLASKKKTQDTIAVVIEQIRQRG